MTRTPLCDDCVDGLQRVVSIVVPITGRYSMKVHALSQYSGPIRMLVLRKHYGKYSAGRQLGQLLAEHAHIDWDQFDCLVPVPLHWTRYASRGFNQAHTMAQAIGVVHGIPVVKGVFRRSLTWYQARLSKAERKKNVAQVFKLNTNAMAQYRGKHVVIVDDLMTTGSTLQAVARVIAEGKPASITAVVAARVP